MTAKEQAFINALVEDFVSTVEEEVQSPQKIEVDKQLESNVATLVLRDTTNPQLDQLRHQQAISVAITNCVHWETYKAKQSE